MKVMTKHNTAILSPPNLTQTAHMMPTMLLACACYKCYSNVKANAPTKNHKKHENMVFGSLTYRKLSSSYPSSWRGLLCSG